MPFPWLQFEQCSHGRQAPPRSHLGRSYRRRPPPSRWNDKLIRRLTPPLQPSAGRRGAALCRETEQFTARLRLVACVATNALIAACAEREFAFARENDAADGRVIPRILQRSAHLFDGSWRESISHFGSMNCDLRDALALVKAHFRECVSDANSFPIKRRSNALVCVCRRALRCRGSCHGRFLSESSVETISRAQSAGASSGRT